MHEPVAKVAFARYDTAFKQLRISKKLKTNI